LHSWASAKVFVGGSKVIFKIVGVTNEGAEVSREKAEHVGNIRVGDIIGRREHSPAIRESGSDPLGSRHRPAIGFGSI